MMYLSLLQNKMPALSSTLEFSLPPGWRKPGTGKFPLQTKLSDVKSSSLRWGLFTSQTSQTFQESALLMVGLRKPGPLSMFSCRTKLAHSTVGSLSLTCRKEGGLISDF